MAEEIFCATRPQTTAQQCYCAAGLSLIRFQIPERCKSCGGEGTVVPEHTIRGTNVTLKWWCNICGSDWPISLEEQQPDRRSTPERRAKPRGDRRDRD